MFVDTHTHTKFSTDSKMKIEDAVSAAECAGLDGIVFSDHFDYDYAGFPDDFHFDFDEYFRTVFEYKEKNKGKPEIFYGVEIGLQPMESVISANKHILSSYSFDCVIGSTHLINRKDPYCGTFYVGQSKYEAYKEYIEEVARNLSLYHDFDIIGHIDYHTRYAPYRDSRFYYRDFPDEIDSIFKTIIEEGIAFEVNTKTYTKNELDTFLLKRYKELGGELVSLGSDAHSSEYIGLAFPKFAQIIKECGFDYIVHFAERKPVFERII